MVILVALVLLPAFPPAGAQPFIESLNKNQGYGLVVLTLVYAVATILLVSEAQKTRWADIRPYVSVEFKQFKWGGHKGVALHIVNTGKTSAKNVQFVATPEIKSTGIRNIEWLFETGIPTISPKAEHLIEYVALEKVAEVPQRYAVTITYDDSRGRKLPADDFILDMKVVW